MKVTLYYCTGKIGLQLSAPACFLEPLPEHARQIDDGNQYTTEVIDAPDGCKLVRSLDDGCVYLAIARHGRVELLFASHIAAYAKENLEGFSASTD